MSQFIMRKLPVIDKATWEEVNNELKDAQDELAKERVQVMSLKEDILNESAWAEGKTQTGAWTFLLMLPWC